MTCADARPPTRAQILDDESVLEGSEHYLGGEASGLCRHWGLQRKPSSALQGQAPLFCPISQS